MLGYFFGCDYSYRSGKLIRLCDVTLPPFFGGGAMPAMPPNHQHEIRIIGTNPGSY